MKHFKKVIIKKLTSLMRDRTDEKLPRMTCIATWVTRKAVEDVDTIEVDRRKGLDIKTII